MQLQNKVILVTGAAGVLGAAVAEAVKAQGGTPVLMDVVRFDSPLGACLSVDLTDRDALRQAIDGIRHLDGVANIAGGFDMGPKVFETPDKQWDFLFDINVKTLRHVLECVVPRLVEQQRGSVVNVGAFGALRGTGHMGAYTAAKSVVMRLTEALSDEVKGDGVNVNAVLPSLIDTPRNRADMPDADHSRWVAPADLAKVVCFLSSDAARAVHGALIPVTGLV